VSTSTTATSSWLLRLLVNYRTWLALGLGVMMSVLLAIKLNASDDVVATSCAYDPQSGQPNPLGMRTFITVTETQGNTDFVYQQFPQTIAAQSPRLMRENNDFYSALIGYSDPEGFSAYDKAMVCKTSSAKSSQSS